MPRPYTPPDFSGLGDDVLVSSSDWSPLLYADQAFLKPTIASWTDEQLSDYAVGCIVKMGAPGVRHLCRSGCAGRASAADYPLANRFDEVDTLVVLDNVLVPWEDVFFTATPVQPHIFVAPCSIIPRSPMSCASSTPPI